MNAHILGLPKDFRGEVRLFPLSDLVLFPGNVLPLHIFESRYKEMLEDALHDDGLVTMATLVPGHEHDYYSRPPVASAVCIGRVISQEKTAQGTYNLTLAGLQRARIAHEIEPVRSFRRAKVHLVGDRPSEANASNGVQARRLANQILTVLPAAKGLVEKLLEHDLPLAALTDCLAFFLPLATELKLQLLAESDARVRVEVLLAALAKAKASAKPGMGRFTDFSNN
jgi:uncharacterized protein